MFLIVLFQESIADNDSDYNLKQLPIKLLHAGKKDKTINIAIVGDGYINKDLVLKGKYESDCERVVKAFLKKTPFQQYQDYFKIYAIYAESYDRGAEDNPGEDKKKNILDSTLETNPDEILKERTVKLQKPERLRQIIKNGWIKNFNIIWVMVNDNRRAGAGAILEYNNEQIPAPVFTIGGDFENRALHEFGHSFANLGDEYVDYPMIKTYPLPAQEDLTQPNLTLVTVGITDTKDSLIKTLKWGHFLELPGAEGVIGAYSGGYYRPKGIYRSQADCFMRTFNSNVDFCYVCQEAIVRTIYQRVGLAFDDKEYHRGNPIKIKVKQDYLTLLESDTNDYFDDLFKDTEKSLKTAEDKNAVVKPIEQIIEDYAQWLEKPGFISTLPIKNPQRLNTLVTDLRNRLKNLKKLHKIE